MKEVIFDGHRWEIDEQLAGDLSRWLDWAEKHRIEEMTAGGARGAHSSSRGRPESRAVRNHAQTKSEEPEQLRLGLAR